MGQSTSNEGRRTTGGNALPKDAAPDVTRFRSAAAQAHRVRVRMGLCGACRFGSATARCAV